MTLCDIVLASSSNIRYALLKNAGVEVARHPVDLDESLLKQRAALEGWPAQRLALHLAEDKARAFNDNDGRLVIGADQLLECDGALFDKPRDIKDARQQLMSLSGRPHQLISAVAIIKNNETLFTHVEHITMTMRDLDDDAIETYLDRMGQEVLETVGCYKLEGLGAQLMEKVEGDYFSVLGLPLLPVLAFLRQSGAII